MRSWLRKKWNSSIPHKSGAPRPLPSLEHLAALSDDVGVIQHAVEDLPNRSTGYCTDDVARAYMVALAKLSIDPQDALAQRLAKTYLSFLHDAQIADGRFHNFMSYDRSWLDSVGTHDSVGRALWALGFGMRFAPRASWRRVSQRLFERGIATLGWLQYPRAQAYAMIGLAHAIEAQAGKDESTRYRECLEPLAQAMKARFLDVRSPDWNWFEEKMTYDNARLPEAMLRAGFALRNDDLAAIGLRSFAFYESVSMEDGVYVPVGNEGWYPRGGRKARYAQQPLEAAAMVDAALVAHDATGDPACRATAQSALDWYYGRNSRGIVMVSDGGCFDGLSERSVNPNMGAESTLAYLGSAYAVAGRPAAALSLAR